MIRMRLMTAADLPLGLHLSEQAGWNQTPADWLRMLVLSPDGCFVAECDGVPIGTICTCRFGSVAWVAMVLVEASRRGQGIGTAMMRHALDFLEQRQVATIRLDATPLGEPVYRKLGFVAEYTLERMGGVLPAWNGLEREEGRVQEASAECLPRLAEFDQANTGTERMILLNRLVEEFPHEARLVVDREKIQGYLMARPGRLAWFLGPCLASGEAGRWLLNDAARRHAGDRVFLDILECNSPAHRWACERGLTVQRKLLRMYRGQPICDDPSRIWASSGP